MIFTTKQRWSLRAAFSMLLLLEHVIAIKFSSANALEPTTNMALEKRAEDCDFAEWQWADVDCNYIWGKSISFTHHIATTNLSSQSDGAQALNYEVRIEPTGQENTQGWCKGIMDNIIGDCGRNFPYTSCEPYLVTNLHHPKTHQVKRSEGVKMTFDFRWQWIEGEDATTCVTSAITKATCHGGITFTNGKCYKRQ